MQARAVARNATPINILEARVARGSTQRVIAWITMLSAVKANMFRGEAHSRFDFNAMDWIEGGASGREISCAPVEPVPSKMSSALVKTQTPDPGS